MAEQGSVNLQDVLSDLDDGTSRWSVLGGVALVVLLVAGGLLWVSRLAEEDDDESDPSVVGDGSPRNLDRDESAATDENAFELDVEQRWARVAHDEAVFGGPRGQTMKSVVEGGPGFVVVGHDVGKRAAAVWTSPDGQTWSRVPHDEAVFGGPGQQQMRSVVQGGPGLVAVGAEVGYRQGRQAAAVWTSSDGRTWSRVPHDESVFGGPGQQVMRSVVQGGPGLVAVGHDDREENARGVAAVWTSPEGRTWSRVPHDKSVFGGPGELGMQAVAKGPRRLVAVGAGSDRAAAVWTSPDGRTWSRVPHDESVFGGTGIPRMLSVTAGGPGFVAVGERWPEEGLDTSAVVWTSPDGRTWSRMAPGGSGFDGSDDQGMKSVAKGGPGLVAVGYNSGRATPMAWTSPDAQKWSPTVPAGSQSSNSGWMAAYSGLIQGHRLLAVGEVGVGDHSAGAVWVGELPDEE